jgi:hypothetical protein
MSGQRCKERTRLFSWKKAVHLKGSNEWQLKESVMSEAEEAWRLWQLLQSLGDALWERYESAFMDFCGEDSRDIEYAFVDQRDDLPF